MSYLDHSNSSFILILGVAGSGRSAFIHSFLGEKGPKPLIGCSIQPQTTRIQEYSVVIGEETVILVDTPGTDFSDDIRQDIEDWMGDRAISRDRIRGFVFLQPITANRMNMTVPKQILDKLLGTGKGQLYRRVVLCTSTRSDQVSEYMKAEYKRREVLIQHKFWGPLKKQGALAKSYDGTSDCARGIIQSILEAAVPDQGKRLGIQVREAQSPLSSLHRTMPAAPKAARFVWSFQSVFKSYRGKFIVLLLGPSGTGKSKFIANVTKGHVKTGDGLSPCTKKICAYQTNLLGRDIVLVDTPGYDVHTAKDSADDRVLRLMSQWLESRNSSWNCFSSGKTTISSILFFYRMPDTRVPRTTQLHAYTLKQWGASNNSLGSIHLVTSLWNEISASDHNGGRREEELKSKLWKEFIDKGSIARRFDKDDASASEILEAVVRDREVGDVPLPPTLLMPPRESQVTS